MGEVPSWYPLMSAARYMKTDPWVLEHQSVVWIHRAHAAMSAEAHAQEMAEKHSK